LTPTRLPIWRCNRRRGRRPAPSCMSQRRDTCVRSRGLRAWLPCHCAGSSCAGSADHGAGLSRAAREAHDPARPIVGTESATVPAVSRTGAGREIGGLGMRRSR
jgi:hypothetical protein